MHIHRLEILKRNVTFLCFIGMAFMFLITMAIQVKSASRKEVPTLIAIDSNGTRIISDEIDPIFKTEAISFIRKFTFNLYNFNSTTFMQRVGLTTTFMSDELWKNKKSEIMNLKDKIERNEISVNGDLQKLNRTDSNNYSAIVEVTENSRLNSRVHKIQVAIKLQSVPRSENNPYGLEVQEYVETPINH